MQDARLCMRAAETVLHDLECAMLSWHACRRCQTGIAPTRTSNSEMSGDSRNAFLHGGDVTVGFQHVPLQKKEREEAPARPSAGSAFVPPSKRGGSFAPPAARARDEVSLPPPPLTAAACFCHDPYASAPEKQIYTYVYI